METPNLHLTYLEPSQAQPEVIINDAWDKIDAHLAGTLEVEQSGDSPGVRDCVKLKFIGATVTEESGGVAVVTVDPTSGGGGGGTFSGCSVRQSADQNMGHATATRLTWDTEDYDTDAYHSTSVNPTRLTAPATGYYLVTGSTRPNNSSPPTIYYNLAKNGVEFISPSVPANGNVDGGGVSIAWEGKLTAGDYIEMGMFVTGGSDVLSDHTSTVLSISRRG